MVSLDKAAIALTMAIVAIALGVAASGGAAQDAGPVVSTPPTVSTETVEPEKMMEETEVMEEEEVMMEEPTGPTTHSVDIPTGTSVPGCEETNSCWSPADITINAGDTVEWNNIDSVAHTVTAGSPTDAQIEVFDSSLLMADKSWSFTFDDAGSYDYFCMVHPWMVGSVTVN